jgi:hypothetical protein
MSWSENFGSSKNDDFPLSKKIAKEFQKNIKFGLVIDFDMEIRLRGSDWSFLTWNEK